ncbi:hypothetical protein L9W80_18240 [Vibrio aestuarianus]|uniref:hypothetical protein n=1 Tax=Vibrio aestuarianus TaxID=28171 RepID=UPI00237CA09B|nr:hypothetical protein [Vibrio aestuarianus]MDE1352081.1 hypothetical protein [Vibrio aestuarianus]
MKLFNYLSLITLLSFSSGTLADESETIEPIPDTEPTQCYKVAWEGLGFTAGQAVELCGGTTDSRKTILCAVKAWSHPKNDGLGLSAGQTIRLCKANPNNPNSSQP